MVGSHTRRVGLIFLGMLVMSLALALWLARLFHVASTAATLMGVVLTAPGTVLAWLAYRGDRDEAASDLEAKARTLSAAVLASETNQVQQLLGLGGHRIDLTFRCYPEPANNAAGAEPQGRLSDVLRHYRQLRPTRLVITGEPGAGKTLLALHLLLAVLADPDRTDTDPVPVRLSLNGWDPCNRCTGGPPSRSANASIPRASLPPMPAPWSTTTGSCPSWTAWTRWTRTAPPSAAAAPPGLWTS